MPPKPSFGSPENLPVQPTNTGGEYAVSESNKYGIPMREVKKVSGGKSTETKAVSSNSLIGDRIKIGERIIEKATNAGEITKSDTPKPQNGFIDTVPNKKEVETVKLNNNSVTNRLVTVGRKIQAEAVGEGVILNKKNGAQNDFAYTVPGNFVRTINIDESVSAPRINSLEKGGKGGKLRGFFTGVTNKLKGVFGGKEENFSFLSEKTNEPTLDGEFFPKEEQEAKATEIREMIFKRIASEAASVEQKKKLEKISKKLTEMGRRTNNIFKNTLEKVGPSGKKLVSLLSSGSEYMNKQVNNKAVRLFASAGLISAGALAAYATPVVLASMAGVGLGLRVVSAAKIYTSARKILDEKYEKRAKEGTKISAIKMAGLEVGALGVALFSGEIIGKVFEGIASLDVVHEIGTSIKNSANIESVTDAWSKLFNGDTSVPVPVDVQPVAVTPPIVSTSPVEITTQNIPAVSAPIEHIASPDPSLIHHVAKGDSLWSLVRGDLSRLNFEGFNTLNQGDQEKMIQELVNKIEVPSGNKQIIRIGQDVLDFNKYLGK